MATNKTTNKNTTKAPSSKGPTKADLEAKIAELQALLEKATAAAAEPAKATVVAAPPAPSTDVTLVYCSDSLGYAKISNMEINCTRYGEEFVMTRSQFDELVGKYRSWFDRGVFAVSYKNADVASAKGVFTDKELGLDVATLYAIGKMSARDLEHLWSGLKLQNLKESVVCYYKRKFVEGDPAFLDREKVDLLDRLTKGGFKREQDELSGRYKIQPTEM